MRLTISGRLPSLNEYIAAERTNRFKAAKMKRDAEERVMWAARSQLRGRIKTPCVMAYKWIEKDTRRDKDNIAFARKFIQDALVKGGYLENDGWRQIARFTDDFDVDKANPRIEVEITEEIR